MANSIAFLLASVLSFFVPVLPFTGGLGNDLQDFLFYYNNCSPGGLQGEQGLVFREPKGSFSKMGCGVRQFTGRWEGRGEIREPVGMWCGHVV